jgi:hypothetical protein
MLPRRLGRVYLFPDHTGHPVGGPNYMRTLGLLLVLTLVCTACASSSKEEAAPSDGTPGEIVAYLKAVSETHGVVGYVKVWEYSSPETGPSFRQYHVHDLNFKKRGFVTEKGTATKFVYLPDEVARVKGETIEMVQLPAQPMEWNVAKILDVPTDIKIVKAQPEDVK